MDILIVDTETTGLDSNSQICELKECDQESFVAGLEFDVEVIYD